MNCQKAQNYLISFIYGELDSRKEKAFREHLNVCSECSEKLAGLTWARECAALAPNPSPGKLTVSKILAEARAEAENYNPGRKLWKSWLRAAAAFGLTAFVGVVGFYQVRTGNIPLDELWNAGSRKEVAVSAVDAKKGESDVFKARTSAAKEEARPPERSAAPNTHVVVGGSTASSNASGNDFVRNLLPSREEDLTLEASTPLESSPIIDLPQARLVSTGERSSYDAASEAPRMTSRAQEPGIDALRSDFNDLFSVLESRNRNQDFENDPASDNLTIGRIALDSGDWSGAANAFRDALSYLPGGTPERLEALSGLARAYEALGDWKEARRYYYLLGQEFPGRRDYASEKLNELAGR